MKKATTKKEAVKKVAKKPAPKKSAKGGSASGGKVASALPTESVVAPVAVSERYVYAVGRRKTSIARVRLYPSAEGKMEEMIVNKRTAREYFGTTALEGVAFAPLRATGLANAFRVSVVARGGGLHGQADAIKLGVARSLIKSDPLLRPTLKALGFLTRDARIVERKKPGLKKARRAPQWAKR